MRHARAAPGEFDVSLVLATVEIAGPSRDLAGDALLRLRIVAGAQFSKDGLEHAECVFGSVGRAFVEVALAAQSLVRWARHTTLLPVASAKA